MNVPGIANVYREPNYSFITVDRLNTKSKYKLITTDYGSENWPSHLILKGILSLYYTIIIFFDQS